MTTTASAACSSASPSRAPSPSEEGRERLRDRQVAYYLDPERDDTHCRSRSVGQTVRFGHVDVPVPPAALRADWKREIDRRLAIDIGDVEALPLHRARMRWPDFATCAQTAIDWMRSLGLHRAAEAPDIALMACRGARFHHDAVRYGHAAFCNLFVSDDQDLDVFFPGTGQRIPLRRGTVMLFDTAQPHAVIDRHGGDRFEPGDFAGERDRSQIFLTWELPIEDARVAQALGIEFDIEPSVAAQLQDPQVQFEGKRVEVCPSSGRWFAVDDLPKA